MSERREERRNQKIVTGRPGGETNETLYKFKKKKKEREECKAKGFIDGFREVYETDDGAPEKDVGLWGFLDIEFPGHFSTLSQTSQSTTALLNPNLSLFSGLLHLPSFNSPSSEI